VIIRSPQVGQTKAAELAVGGLTVFFVAPFFVAPFFGAPVVEGVARFLVAAFGVPEVFRRAPRAEAAAFLIAIVDSPRKQVKCERGILSRHAKRHNKFPENAATPARGQPGLETWAGHFA
jgi:hypothetical protein